MADKRASAQYAVAQPPTPDARQIKAAVRELRAQGASANAIKAELVSRFGPDVLSLPLHKKRLIALGIGLLLATVMGALIRSHRRRRLDRTQTPDQRWPDEKLRALSDVPIEGASVPIGNDDT
jgi:cytochrome c-type biogenesis protein CcmH/NrfF